MLKLCNPKTQVLLKETKKPIFEQTELITVNNKFDNNNIRLNLVPIQSAAKMAESGVGAKAAGDIDEEVQKER